MSGVLGRAEMRDLMEPAQPHGEGRYSDQWLLDE